MRAQVNWFFGRWVAAALPPPGRGMVPMSVDWEAVGRILEAHHAMQGQFIPGTSNWGAAIWKAALGIKEGS